MTPHRFIHFLSVAGVGWLISITSLLLLSFYWGTFYANLFGDSLAVIYVFYRSTYSVFKSTRSYIFLRFIVFVIYQLLLISLVSFVLTHYTNSIYNFANALAQWFFFIPYLETLWLYFSPLLVSKILITPLTIIANFLLLNKLLSNQPS